MTADLWSEDARGIWQNQESVVTRMSANEMRTRAERWNRELGGTKWVPFAVAGVLILFFVWMLLINETPLQRAGAMIGIVSAVYLVYAGLQVASRRWFDDGASCVRAYKAQLERRRQADIASARTILLAMTGCALLSSSEDWVSWTLQATSQLGAGVVVYAFLSRQARRFLTRINELTLLEGGA